MANLNLVQIMGRLAVKPEVKTTPNGVQIGSFAVATNRTWKDKNTGEKKEEVDFHGIVVFGKTAETIAKYFNKGDEIYIQGRLKTRSWDDPNGVKRYKTEVIADRFDFGQKVKRDVEQKQEEPVVEAEEEVALEDIPF